MATTKKKSKSRRNPITTRKPPGRGKPSKAARLRGKAGTTPGKPAVPKPAGRRTDKNREVAEIIMKFIRDMRRLGGIDDVFHRLPD